MVGFEPSGFELRRSRGLPPDRTGRTLRLSASAGAISAVPNDRISPLCRAPARRNSRRLVRTRDELDAQRREQRRIDGPQRIEAAGLLEIDVEVEAVDQQRVAEPEAGKRLPLPGVTPERVERIDPSREGGRDPGAALLGRRLLERVAADVDDPDVPRPPGEVNLLELANAPGEPRRRPPRTSMLSPQAIAIGSIATRKGSARSLTSSPLGSVHLEPELVQRRQLRMLRLDARLHPDPPVGAGDLRLVKDHGRSLAMGDPVACPAHVPDRTLRDGRPPPRSASDPGSAPGPRRRSRRLPEREITRAVDLCDARGLLNPDAVGFSRQPLVRANLSGHWPRKKKWNFWNWIGPEFVFSVTLADIDLASFCSFTLTDLSDGAHWSGASYGLSGRFALPEVVEASVAFQGGGLEYDNRVAGADLAVRFRGRAGDGTAIAAEFDVRRPAGHESLNVVVPWTPARFQCNSKHAALPCQGELRAGDRRYALDPRSCFAVQDWGRGIWPYRSFWNWGVATGWAGRRPARHQLRRQVDHRHRLERERDPVQRSPAQDHGRPALGVRRGEWRKPWRVVAPHSGALDLVLEPVAAHTPRLNLGLLATGGVCAFGRWRGRVRVEGRELAVDGLLGWAEEFAHRW